MNAILKNSYLVAIIFFTIFYLFCYIFKFCYTFEYENQKIVSKFNFKRLIAYTLIIWLLWNFVLFPQDNAWETNDKQQYKTDLKNLMKNSTNNIQLQKINFEIWK